MEQQIRDSAVGFEKKSILYVGGLDEKVSEETLNGAFIPFGEVVNIELPRDPLTKKHRGFAFVEFEEAEDATHAIDNMEASEMYGRILKVNHAKPSTLAKSGVWAEAGQWFNQSLPEDSKEVEAQIRNQVRSKRTMLEEKEKRNKERQQQLLEKIAANEQKALPQQLCGNNQNAEEMQMKGTRQWKGEKTNQNKTVGVDINTGKNVKVNDYEIDISREVMDVRYAIYGDKKRRRTGPQKPMPKPDDL